MRGREITLKFCITALYGYAQRSCLILKARIKFDLLINDIKL